MTNSQNKIIWFVVLIIAGVISWLLVYGAIRLPVSAPNTIITYNDSGQEVTVTNNAQWVLIFTLLFSPILIAMIAFWKVLSFYIRSAPFKLVLILIVLMILIMMLGILRYLGHGGINF